MKLLHWSKVLQTGIRLILCVIMLLVVGLGIVRPPSVEAGNSGAITVLNITAGFIDGVTGTSKNAAPASASSQLGPENDAYFSVTTRSFSRFLAPAVAAVKRSTGVTIHKQGWAIDLKEALGPVINGKGGNATIIWGDLDHLYSLFSYTPGQWRGFDLRGVQFSPNPLLLVVRPESPIKTMTKEQLTDILSGKNTRFSPKGAKGPQWEVKVQLIFSGGVIDDMIRRDYIGGRPFGENVQVQESNHSNYEILLREITKAIWRNYKAPDKKNAVGIITIGIIDSWNVYPYRKMLDGLSTVKTDFTLNIPYTLITKGSPSPAITKVMDYFHGAGIDFVTPVTPLK